MSSSLRQWFARVLVLTQLINGALCWGKEGHYTVCKIAESYFEEETVAAVKKLLPKSADGDLASVCSWPDEIKHHWQWRWTSPLHYVDTPDYRCNYEYCRPFILPSSNCLPVFISEIQSICCVCEGDCHDTHKNQDRCVTGAIFNYTMQLMSASENSDTIVHYNLTEALMFLSHFIGDIHQPLHVGFLGDEGGNTITVRWYRRKTNLHHVWDNMIIESALKTYYNKSLPLMIEALQANLTNDWSNDVPLWESCQLNQTACPNPYASESINLACKYAYRNATPGTTLGDDYFLSRLPIVEKRLAQGGIRLAATLNRIFSSKPKHAGS
ncbi:endonuclease 4 [Arabidopsis thaliana]|uniref:Aspergillus nuclease S1 n=2 Tax=Arabidopsis thaliana TaxID=3702 RepID=A0A1P8B3M9_ARATH|nr:endonuclease 4 [Arabidopsis thaliana]ANM66200.1 endonuclease 4 [Arabidopsis thaliana]|eukprot:NP_001328109.1 endonuclease 4 [Arabidopsis thaliana]